MLNKIVELGISEREAKELINVSSDIERDYVRLKNNYPIQYLIGYVDFYGYKINVNESVLIPRYETEYLVEKLIKYSKELFDKKVRILDIGTGSGAISIALNKNIDSEIDACDISGEALDIAKKNALNNKCNINFIKSDIFSIINDKYDIIVSNPPYISYTEEVMDSVYKYEPHLALFASNNGLYFYEEILKNASMYLNSKFIIAFEIGYTQGEDIINIAKKYFNNSKIILEKDLSLKDRYIFIINE